MFANGIGQLRLALKSNREVNERHGRLRSANGDSQMPIAKRLSGISLPLPDDYS